MRKMVMPLSSAGNLVLNINNESFFQKLNCCVLVVGLGTKSAVTIRQKRITAKCGMYDGPYGLQSVSNNL
jgi:hypothetical protein